MSDHERDAPPPSRVGVVDGAATPTPAPAPKPKADTEIVFEAAADPSSSSSSVGAAEVPHNGAAYNYNNDANNHDTNTYTHDPHNNHHHHHHGTATPDDDVDPASHSSGTHSLTWYHLAAIAYVMTSCGPYGLEPVVGYGGALWSLVAILLVPVLYVIPQVLMVSELALLMPSNHGYILWVHRGWGPFAAFFNGYNALVVNTIDIALYPVLASDYALRVLIRFGVTSETSDFAAVIVIRAGLVALGTFVACLSAKNVGALSMALCGSIVLIFVVFALIAAPHMDLPAQITADAGTGALSGSSDDSTTSDTGGGGGGGGEDMAVKHNWGAFTAAALWLYTGWHALGALAGDVDNEGVDSTEEGAPTAMDSALSASSRRQPPPASGTTTTTTTTGTTSSSNSGQLHRPANAEVRVADDTEMMEQPLRGGRDYTLRGLDPSRASGAAMVAGHTTSGVDNGTTSVAAAAAAPPPSAPSEVETDSTSTPPPPPPPTVSMTFFTGLAAALLISIATYILPLITAMTSAKARDTEWTDGFLVDAIDYAVPHTFAISVLLAVVAQFGLFYSSLLCYARVVWGLAELGWLPSYLCKRAASSGTPVRATLTQATVMVPLIFLDFSFLQRLELVLVTISYVLTFTAFLRLRYTEPDAVRPFKVPGGMPVAWLTTVTKVAVVLAVMITNLTNPILLVAAVAINGCIALGYLYGRYQERRRWQQEEEEAEEEEEERRRSAAEAAGGASDDAEAHVSGDVPLSMAVTATTAEDNTVVVPPAAAVPPPGGTAP